MLSAATLYCGESELGYLQMEMWSACMPQEVSPAESKTALARGTIICKITASHEWDSLDMKSVTYYISDAGGRAFFIKREDEKAVKVMSKSTVYILNPI
jgi:hypothetical protein